MAKYRDRTGMGKSKLITRKVRKDESGSDRHSRRLHFNVKNVAVIQQWCLDKKISLYIRNQGHHWIFIDGTRKAEWWPSSAKLVFNKKRKQGIHVHDYLQVIKAITEQWKLN